MYMVKMDGSGRITKRNRRFLRPITPFNQQLQSKDEANTINTGPSADSREATSSVTPSQPSTAKQPVATDKSGHVQHIAPDTLPQSRPMTDKDFNALLTHAVQNVRNIPQQYKGTPPEAARNVPTNTQPKRVKFKTKRFIQEY